MPVAESPRPERTDAQRNRARILEVAREVLAVDGDASLNSIAKKAGVGQGTLYRHFPTREALVLAVYRAEIQRVVDWTPELVESSATASVALRAWFAHLAELLRIKRGLADAVTAAGHDAMTTESHGPVISAIARILRAGEADGSLRPGLDPDDVLMVMSCVWRVPAGEQAERLLDLILDAVRA
ncbi:TetR/AcrR family transcriptional regulator [Pseudonocardia sp. CA-107938]|uniref:TetR/AcrR family transcriptional regulator n=1 Tax=Pseudonocardia sp. CA-107938 TaxID=3240021 RepID=UPI003D8DC7F6